MAKRHVVTVPIRYLQPGQRFHAPWSGRTGRLVSCSDGFAAVDLDAQGALRFERLQWSAQTEVQPLDEDTAV